MRVMTILVVALGLTACGDLETLSPASVSTDSSQKYSNSCSLAQNQSLNLKVVGCDSKGPIYQSISVYQPIISKDSQRTPF
jgi:predicted small lipoprotein YifL